MNSWTILGVAVLGVIAIAVIADAVKAIRIAKHTGANPYVDDRGVNDDVDADA